MDTYSLLRQIADSWVLLAMFAFFIGAIIWAFRPGSTAVYADVSNIPLRDDTPEKGCSGTCETCACTTSLDALKGAKDV